MVQARLALGPAVHETLKHGPELSRNGICARQQEKSTRARCLWG